MICNELSEAIRARDEWREKFERLQSHFHSQADAAAAFCCWEDCDQQPIYCRDHFEQETAATIEQRKAANALRARVEQLEALCDDAATTIELLRLRLLEEVKQ
jgi:hypothetical protein